MQLRKIKRPAGVFGFEVRWMAEDAFGSWLYSPAGSTWKAPHRIGTLPFDAALLLNPKRPWVVWWLDDPADRRIEIDVCLPPERDDAGWSFIDLELDIVRHQNGRVEIQDRDEFEQACRDGWISAEEGQIAESAVQTVLTELCDDAAALKEEGWRRLRHLL